MNIIESNLQFNGNLSYGNNPDCIILHHAEASSCTMQDIHQWHLANGWIGCGYHFLVRKDGNIYRGRPESAIGAHCPNYNSHSIGICAEGEYMTETMPQIQKEAIIELGIYIKNKYSINTIYRHGDVYETDCCGVNYPVSEVKNGILGGNYTPNVTPQIVNNNPTTSNINTIAFLQHQLNLQFNANLVEDNIAGQQTLNACSKVILKVGSSGEITRWLQTKLNQLGFNCGSADGVFGSCTLQAVKSLQSQYGLASDGVVGTNTWTKLLGL